VILELVIGSVRYTILLVIVLIGVAFITLIEQKILASSQIRLGPNYVGYLGLFQPFADAVKLLTKETIRTRVRSIIVYYISPVLSLALSLILWLVYPLDEGGVELIFRILLFICVRGLGVYPILRRGWSSNCKYSILGSIRAVAQIVSYEVRLAVVLLRLI
jgi:NADH-ubiquinone oxidoreductase chain 1